MTEGEAPASPAPAAAGPNGCPISDDFLPPNMKKHVDPKAPVPLRMMAAKGLVPLGPTDMVGALFLLTYDADANVRETASKTAAGLPDRIVSSAFRDEAVKGPVLGWILPLFADKDQYAEMLILNGSTPDDAVAAIAATCNQRTAEIIGNNQLRILRHDNIIRQLAKNPACAGALIDGVCDFAVRSGVNMPDVPQIQEARVRLFGAQAVAAPAAEEAGDTAESIIQDFAGTEEGAAPMEEQVKLSLSKRIMKLNISQKIKLATQGNKEARGILIRDSNRLVCTAVIRSPRITDGEVLTQANSKIASDDVLRIIYNNREWLRQYPIKLALVKNPKVPQAIAMRILNQLHEADVKGLARDRNVPGTVQQMAKKMVAKREAPKKDDDH